MDNEEKVQLRVMGISYSPLQSGAFAMLLAEVDGPYRIPVVIGAAEAQSIAIKMEGIVTPRPITHDLFCSMAHAFGLELVEVFIYKFEDGIFLSEMKWKNGEIEVSLDARTSDAVAIAMRTGSAIYTTREILHTVGSIFEERDGKIYANNDNRETVDADADQEADIEKLQTQLEEYIKEENYEEAAKISELIKKLKK